MKIRYYSASNSMKIALDDGTRIVVSEVEDGRLRVVSSSKLSLDEKMGQFLFLLFYDKKIDHDRGIYEKEHGKFRLKSEDEEGEE